MSAVTWQYQVDTCDSKMDCKRVFLARKTHGISRTPTDIVDVIDQLDEWATDIEASALVTHVVQLLGAQWFVYSTLLPSIPDKTNDSFRYFIGWRPELCALHRERKWMMDDPFFHYSRNSSAPLASSKIKVLTPG